MVAVLGRKGTMTQLFDERGAAVAVTAIEVDSCVVVAKRTKGDDGYEALQLGFGKANPKRLTKPRAGYFRKVGVEPVRFLKEVRGEPEAELAVGQRLGADVLQPGDLVHVAGSTKGRGFAGGVKRWGWSSGPATHGSMSHRRVGAVGAGSSPGRVVRGRHLPGHYGTERVTVRNLRVIKVEPEKNLVYVTGAVPGNRGGMVMVRKAGGK